MFNDLRGLHTCIICIIIKSYCPGFEVKLHYANTTFNVIPEQNE